MVGETRQRNHRRKRLKRMKVFGENYLFVLEHNAKYAAGKVSHYVEMNKFAAHTREEYQKMLGFKKSLWRKKDSDDKDTAKRCHLVGIRRS